LFLFAGGFKLLAPIDVVQQQLPLPATLIRLIATLEVLGALGLVLPSLLRVQPMLTPLAAVGLSLLMAGATILTPELTGGEVAPAALPLIVGVLAASIAYGRWRVAPVQMRLAH
jgi:hypothetical protein